MAEKPDLYIGLICAAGTDLTEVKQQLQAQLAVVGYKYGEIKVSSAIADALDIARVDDEYERMLTLSPTRLVQSLPRAVMRSHILLGASTMKVANAGSATIAIRKSSTTQTSMR